MEHPNNQNLMKKRGLIVWLLFISSVIYGQLLTTEKSTVTFFSDALLEDITASTTKANALIDLSKAEVAFDVPIKEFQFAKDLMKQHFNEKYMETEKYPKATFGGKLTGFSPEKLGEQSVNAEGKLTIHGVTKPVKIPGTIEVIDGKKAVIKAKFMVKLEDYKVKIPSVVFQNIAEEVEVTLEFIMKAN
jgi:polyisoprenoid-binding protein YceI